MILLDTEVAFRTFSGRRASHIAVGSCGVNVIALILVIGVRLAKPREFPVAPWHWILFALSSVMQLYPISDRATIFYLPALMRLAAPVVEECLTAYAR